MVLFNWSNFVMGFSKLDTVRILHFDALDFILHSSPHNCNASRSFCICTWSCIDLIVRYIKQSSANKRTCVPGSTTLGRSFMNNKNKRGPIPVPWGTQDFTSAESDVLPSTTTCRLRWLLTVEQLLHWSDWICTGWAVQIKAKQSLDSEI